MTPPPRIPLQGPVELLTLRAKLPALFLAGAKASERFWEFFAANIRNKNTRRAYYKAVCRFLRLVRGARTIQSQYGEASSRRCFHRRTATDAFQTDGQAVSGGAEDVV